MWKDNFFLCKNEKWQILKENEWEKNKKLEYFFIGWKESDSNDECVAKFGKWHVPESSLSSTKISAVLVNVQSCFLDGNGLSMKILNQKKNLNKQNFK